jgi:hypothetical protein
VVHDDRRQMPDEESGNNGYDAPKAEEVDSTEGPALTSAGFSGPTGPTGPTGPV